VGVINGKLVAVHVRVDHRGHGIAQDIVLLAFADSVFFVVRLDAWLKFGIYSLFRCSAKVQKTFNNQFLPVAQLMINSAHQFCRLRAAIAMFLGQIGLDARESLVQGV
jgi:hypothetical protein